MISVTVPGEDGVVTVSIEHIVWLEENIEKKDPKAENRGATFKWAYQSHLLDKTKIFITFAFENEAQAMLFKLRFG